MAGGTEQTTEIRKDAMIQALEKCLGVVTQAAKLVGINRITHYKWMEDDEEYKLRVSMIGEMVIDFAESQLHKQIEAGEVASTIFYLKTKGKKRGYVEREERRQVDEEGNTVAQELTIKIVRDTASSITPGDFTPKPAASSEPGEAV